MVVVSLEELHLGDSVLEPLLTISGSPTLVEALQVLVETSRSVDGRLTLASRCLLPIILELINSLDQSSAHHHYLILSCLRLLRNLCAGEALNQKMFIDHNGVEIVFRVICLIDCSVDNSTHWVVRLGLQVLANASLAGETHQLAIWRCFFPIEFLKIAGVRKKEICDPLCMIIYVCSDGVPELFSELCINQGLAIMEEVIRTTKIAGFEERWVKLLLSRICIEGPHLPHLFNQLKSGSEFTQEQAFLLRVVSEIMNERIGEVQPHSDFSLHILGICKEAMHIVDFTTRCQSDLPTGHSAINLLGYSLYILRDICSVDSSIVDDSDKDSKDAVSSLLSEGILDLLLSLLQELELPSQVRKVEQEEENQEMSERLCPYKGFRRDIIAIIGNCAYRRKYVQDEIRRRNCILLLLQQCVLDEDNPFLREWGIWSMRNILENNAENIKLVKDLECQGSVDVPEISEAGLRVEVDRITGRAKLVNKN